MKARNRFSTHCRSSAGQGLIEALALSFAAMGFISTFFAIFYFSFVHVGTNYLLHEHLLCNATKNSVACRKDFETKAKVFLVSAKILQISTHQDQGQFQGTILIQMPWNRRLEIKKFIEVYR